MKDLGQEERIVEGVVEELSDVLIWIFDLCGSAHLDLARALLAKMKKNRTHDGSGHGKRF